MRFAQSTARECGLVVIEIPVRSFLDSGKLFARPEGEKWNRGCFGYVGGKAHLRIENRVLPSGPTVLDKISNAAFFISLMSAGPAALPDVSERMAFSDAEGNFLAAAQAGLEARFTWLDSKPWSARDLIGQELLPMAQELLPMAQDGC